MKTLPYLVDCSEYENPPQGYPRVKCPYCGVCQVVETLGYTCLSCGIEVSNKIKDIEIIITDRDGYKMRVNDLYWFEENGIHSLEEGEAHWGEKFAIEVYVRGERVYSNVKS